VSRTPLPSPAPGRWAGLRLDVEGPARPGLRVEVTGGRRLLLRQGDQVVLLGMQRAAHRGVYYVRTNRFHSPLPPVDAALARRLRPADGSNSSPPIDATLADRHAGESGGGARQADRGDAAWAARWTHRFADWLQAAAGPLHGGPLHTGPWTLAWGMPSWSVAAHWSRLPSVDPDRGHITWFGYGDPDDDQRDILPLRRLAAPDAARVRSYRRQVREGILPPVLLWWVSGLNTLLVLDGHDRISAALAEGGRPDVVVLAPAPDPAGEAAGHEQLMRDTRGSLAPRFAEQVAVLARAEGRTRAWPLPGGPPAWDREAGGGSDGWSRPHPDDAQGQ
jgi:hypothetical protein